MATVDEILQVVGDGSARAALEAERARLVERIGKIDAALALMGGGKVVPATRDSMPAPSVATPQQVEVVKAALGDGKVRRNAEISRSTGLRSEVVSSALVALRSRGEVIHSGHQGRGSMWQLVQVAG